MGGKCSEKLSVSLREMEITDVLFSTAGQEERAQGQEGGVAYLLVLGGCFFSTCSSVSVGGWQIGWILGFIPLRVTLFNSPRAFCLKGSPGGTCMDCSLWQ